MEEEQNKARRNSFVHTGCQDGKSGKSPSCQHESGHKEKLKPAAAVETKIKVRNAIWNKWKFL